MTLDTKITQAAARLFHAQASHIPCPPVRDLIGRKDVAAAYAVQRANANRALDGGRQLVGRKIGLTSQAIQAQLGVDQPDYGALFADRAFDNGATIRADLFLQPRIEAEVALCLKTDIPATPIEMDELIAAIDWAAPALEIVDSRIANWDISLADTIADNASYGGHVIGAPVRDLSGLDMALVEMELSQDEAIVSKGSGRDCMGSPLIAALWLANTLAAFGTPSKAGDLLLTGALGPMVAVQAGQRFHAKIRGLGEVGCAFT